MEMMNDNSSVMFALQILDGWTDARMDTFMQEKLHPKNVPV